MEEDAGVKAPVTRLRRRLSVEQTEESKSPAVNTPKKRGGRRAKPDLELIDENTPENTNSRRSKKTAVKEIIDTAEEKVITPSRRNTRIKSNTSIVSETALAVGSPRAKRAARRASQVGSDSEAPPTPIRQSRRTRKDSASSVEIAEPQPLPKPVLQITEVIVEEPENNGRKSINNSEKEDNSSPSSTRRSPRLANKKPSNNDNDNSTKATKEESQNTPPKKSKSKKSIDSSLPSEQEISGSKLSQKEETKRSEFSTSTCNLIKDLEVVVTKLKPENLNKSASAIIKHDKEKRKRTKSWTTLTVSNEGNYYSDNEFSKKKIGEKKDILPLNKSGSGDAETSMQDKSNISLSKSKKKDKSILVEKNNDSVNMSRNESIKKKNNDGINSPSLNSQKNDNISELFEKEPSDDIQTTVYIEEDSDSNTGKNAKNGHDNEDQCVPVVKQPDEIPKVDNQLNLISKEEDSPNPCKENTSINNSCEPMDVDETIPENLLLEMQSNEVGSAERNSVSKYSQESNISRKESLNQSKRKSSISQNPDNSNNENKSTLILSQIKDSSSNDFNIEAKSPQIKNDILSKTSEILNLTQENEIKKNISLNCVTTSTPLQQKNIQKLALQVNTSSIMANENINDIEDGVKQKTKNITVDNENSSDESGSEVPDPGSSKKKAELSGNNIEPKTKNSNNDKLNELDENHEKSLEKQENLTRNNTRDSDVSSKSDNECLNNEKKITGGNSSKPSLIKKNMSEDEVEVDSVNNSSDEMESDDEIKETNSLLDDKAIDAGDDYKSGDSQDESEREYEQQNNIIEKGETLTSEEDFSDDTDYEKDSFVVSSAEEDNDLLDGSEDDLSMSDNELKMTAKSKKKFNERKLKEQKKASKEMYEARHKLNTSKSIKSKRNKRQQLSSSESEDESEIKSQVTRHNRMRLDSTNEGSMLDDIPEKKTKRLSESICEENVNEMEISITNESLKESDPLSTEPKTPQKRNSSIAFINSEDINDDDKNELTKTQTEIIDPLDDSSSSDTENIMQNYDSILENLNKTNKSKPKTFDTSLNLDKKMKKQKSALVDELNLTQLKSAKKDQKAKENISLKIENQEDGESSDSIDLHLLFSEDSNNSEDVIDKKQDKVEKEEEFIPLKRTDARTNIREDENNLIQTVNTSLNSSLKKNKKRKSKIEESTEPSETETNSVSFFIDTEGTHASMNKSHNISLNKSHNISLNQKKKFKENDELDSSDSDEAPSQKTNLSLNKSLNKSLPQTPAGAKKNSSKVELDSLDSDEAPSQKTNLSLNKSLNKSLPQTPASAKKNSAKVEFDSSDSDEPPSQKTYLSLNKSLNKSLPQTPASAKKNSSKVEIKISPDNDSDSDAPVEISFIKEKRNTEVQDTEAIGEDITDSVADRSINKSNAATPVSEKKKKKKAKDLQVTDPNVKEAPAEISLNISVSSGKKKKNKQSQGTPAKEIDDAANVSLNVSKSKKKNISISEIQNTPKSEIESVNISKIKTPNSQKKTKDAVHDESVENSEDMNTKSKKRKRNPSLNVSIENTEIDKGADQNTSKDVNESIVSSQKKKRKTSQQNVVEQTQEDNIPTYTDKKENKSQYCQNENEVPAENTKRKRNKRKEREDDEDIATTKVSKNSFDIQVPRLPAGILNQLDDKPHKINIAKKARVISTTQFLVEESIKRKNKPSHYLEESVCLDDEEIQNKKQKNRLIKPKVLPFVPTAITSDAGYTTNFKVNVIPKEIKFVAQSSNISNFKNEFLYKNKVRRQGTYEMYKKNRTAKMSKF